MNQRELFQALTEHRGSIEPLWETTSVLCYEVGRMLEHSMYLRNHKAPSERAGALGFFKSELPDAIAQLVLICQSVGLDFDEQKELGIEKAMERFTGKEVKR